MWYSSMKVMELETKHYFKILKFGDGLLDEAQTTENGDKRAALESTQDVNFLKNGSLNDFSKQHTRFLSIFTYQKVQLDFQIFSLPKERFQDYRAWYPDEYFDDDEDQVTKYQDNYNLFDAKEAKFHSVAKEILAKWQSQSRGICQKLRRWIYCSRSWIGWKCQIFRENVLLRNLLMWRGPDWSWRQERYIHKSIILMWAGHNRMWGQCKS